MIWIEETASKSMLTFSVSGLPSSAKQIADDAMIIANNKLVVISFRTFFISCGTSYYNILILFL